MEHISLNMIFVWTYWRYTYVNLEILLEITQKFNKMVENSKSIPTILKHLGDNLYAYYYIEKNIFMCIR
jgi:hypothetical protein